MVSATSVLDQSMLYHIGYMIYCISAFNEYLAVNEEGGGWSGDGENEVKTKWRRKEREEEEDSKRIRMNVLGTATE